MRGVQTFSGLLLCGAGLSASAQQPPVSFAANVLPIFEKHCMDCHQATRVVDGEKKKPKGGVRLDGARAIAMGGENGAMILPGKYKESRLFEVIALPPDHADIMPPTGDPLTKQEQFIIAKWIHEGAKFQGWRGNEEGLPDLVPSTPGAPLQAADDVFAQVGGGEAAVRLSKAGATVTQVTRGSNQLIIEFASQSVLVNDASIQGLGELGAQVFELNLARSKITDKALEEVEKLENLQHLNLSQTQITDAGIQHLRGLKNLTYLNLYDTKVSDAGLSALAGCKNLQALYVWKTSVTDAGIYKLKSALPALKIVKE